MPYQNEHIKKAIHNKSFFDSFDFDTTRYVDWLITILFYICLHYVDSKLAQSNFHPSTHETRDRYISRTSLRHVFAEYRLLKDESENARYTDTSDCTHKRQRLKDELIPAFEKIKSKTIK